MNLKEVVELKRLCYGHIVYEKLWEKLQLSSILEDCLRADASFNFTFDLNETILYTVIHKLLRRKSKLAAYRDKDEFYQIGADVELHNMYQSLDFLSANKATIETALFARKRTLFNQEIDIAFYDVTTYHFESQRDDELRDFGFSKAGKYNEVQVVMGLFCDTEGNPIGYELFPGNTFDGKTMVNALTILKERFAINKVIIVADKGLNSKANFHLIKEAGYEYIVSARLKNLPKEMKQTILEREGFTQGRVPEEGEINMEYVHLPYEVKYKEGNTTYEWTDQLLVTWTAKRARKDIKNRLRQLEKAEKLLAGKVQLVNRKGAKRYLKAKDTSGGKAIGLDEQQIAIDAQWDGLYGIQYSDEKLSTTEVLNAYHQLWRIEESFRMMKSTLHTRPIFHWTEKRIRGHFMMCFLAFLLERMLERKLKEKHLHLSPDQIKQSLNHLQLSHIKHKKQEYLLKGSNGEYGAKILRALNIKPLQNLQKIEK